MEDLRALDERNNKLYFERLERDKSISDADKVFATAAQEAREWIYDEHLWHCRDELGEIFYHPGQGYKAACYSAEHTKITVEVQLAILRRLDRNRNYCIGIILLLIYISSQLS